jgi:hypothetical protein
MVNLLKTARSSIQYYRYLRKAGHGAASRVNWESTERRLESISGSGGQDQPMRPERPRFHSWILVHYFDGEPSGRSYVIDRCARDSQNARLGRLRQRRPYLNQRQ